MAQSMWKTKIYCRTCGLFISGPHHLLSDLSEDRQSCASTAWRSHFFNTLQYNIRIICDSTNLSSPFSPVMRLEPPESLKLGCERLVWRSCSTRRSLPTLELGDIGTDCTAVYGSMWSSSKVGSENVTKWYSYNVKGVLKKK